MMQSLQAQTWANNKNFCHKVETENDDEMKKQRHISQSLMLGHQHTEAKRKLNWNLDV